ncbi:MAG: DUF5682 family protein [Paracoccaceae bacterium]
MAAAVRYLGIRHHGPGSARRLVEALDALKPVEVLIEGPADLTPLLALAAKPGMVPPVALLAYPADDPDRAVFWPMAAFSPEYQAVCWAERHGAAARFIDLPASWRMAEAAALVEETDENDPTPGTGDDFAPDAGDDPAPDTGDDPAPDAGDAATEPEPGDRGAPETGDDADLAEAIRRDPIGVLARIAGYEDGESWWAHVIEENPEPGPIFEAVAEAMAALREAAPVPDAFEAAREAHMRLEIAAAAKRADGPVAVVCGAWHVPALAEKHALKDDRARVRGAPKRKVSATWTPWTAPRLAFASGYGAGVAAPGWCRHLWETPREAIATTWVARIARALREGGHVVSTASLIETERLALSLAALRGKPGPGFEELREAAVACLCDGHDALWRTIATELLIGAEVGEIPDDVPLAPLLEDLKRAQKRVKLKPEALERELSLDLRSESGLARSTLLHRLEALDVPWGTLSDAGSSRGTFRERWVLAWKPEFAVALVENTVHGATIETAAAGRTLARMREAADLGTLADLILRAMTARLDGAAREGTRLIDALAARTDNAVQTLAALPPLAEVLRYGEARASDTGRLADLFSRLAVQAALALPYAARDLDEEATEGLRRRMLAAAGALGLVDDPEASAAWARALERLLGDDRAGRAIAGLAARLLYEADRLAPEAAAALLARMLSPGTPVKDAAGFFAGFLEGAGQRLVHDEGLRRAVDGWLVSLDEAAFVEHLPLFRRVFSDLDAAERRRLVDAALGRRGPGLAGLAPAPEAATRWPAHEALVMRLLRGESVDG